MMFEVDVKKCDRGKKGREGKGRGGDHLGFGVLIEELKKYHYTTRRKNSILKKNILYADFSPVFQMGLMLPDYLDNMCSQFLFL